MKGNLQHTLIYDLIAYVNLLYTLFLVLVEVETEHIPHIKVKKIEILL